MKYCPYCNSRLKQVSFDSACGLRWYYECFDCGYCSDEEYEGGYYFDDPDREYDERDLKKI